MIKPLTQGVISMLAVQVLCFMGTMVPRFSCWTPFIVWTCSVSSQTNGRKTEGGRGNRCSKQAGIMQYFQTKTIGSFPDKSIGTQSMGEGESIELEESIQMTDQDISSLTIKNISTYEQLTAPSVKEMGKPAAVRLEEEVRIEDDILKQTTSVNTTECVLDKKKLRCLEHECAIKVMNVSSRKWQR